VVDDFEAVLVGASVHAGRHQRAVCEFVRSNREALSATPTGFFQVSLSSADEEGEVVCLDSHQLRVRAAIDHELRVGDRDQRVELAVQDERGALDGPVVDERLPGTATAIGRRGPRSPGPDGPELVLHY
jgi:hypothetical protein